MKLLPVLLLLAACSSIPIDQLSGLTPAECRSYGVEVEDGRPITGTIVRSEFGWSHDLERECNPNHADVNFSGCAKPVEWTGIAGWISVSHEYEIWYSDTLCVPEHEACHALYETMLHTERHDIRTYTGDQFAACPAHRMKLKNRWPEYL